MKYLQGSTAGEKRKGNPKVIATAKKLQGQDDGARRNGNPYHPATSPDKGLARPKLSIPKGLQPDEQETPHNYNDDAAAVSPVL